MLKFTDAVAGPNSLWHIGTNSVLNFLLMFILFIDGYHKLIRWKLVIHGGIDGYSRVIVFLACGNNNRADTVLRSLFSQACLKYFIPSRVRCDKRWGKYWCGKIHADTQRRIYNNWFFCPQSTNREALEGLI